MHLTDINAAITAEDSKKKLKKINREYLQEQIKILSLRPIVNQAATVAMRGDVGADFDIRGWIKIGWIDCRVRKRINIMMYYRYLQFGHRSNER